MSSSYPNNRNKKCLFILGMHRSGTSALAGMLHHLGFNLGDNLMPENTYNKKGYYEDMDIYKLNDNILSSYGRKWDSIYPFEAGSHDYYKRKIQDLFFKKINDSTSIVIKDPRISLLYPLWEDALREVGVSLYVIIAIRNPVEIADSLSRRDGIATFKALLLWANYVLSAEKYTKNEKRTFIHYDKVLSHPKEVMESLFKQLKFKQDISLNKLDKATEFIDKSLKHHHREEIDKIVGVEWIIELYNSLCRFKIEDIEFELFRNELNRLVEQFYHPEIIDTISRDVHFPKTSLLLDVGFGFDNKSRREAYANYQNNVFNLNFQNLIHLGEANAVRWVPDEGVFIKIKIFSITYLDESGSEVNIPKGELKSNATLTKGGWHEFHTTSPWMEFSVNNTKIVELTISGKLWKLDTKAYFLEVDDQLNQTLKELRKVEGERKQLQNEKHTWYSEVKDLLKDTKNLLSEKNELLTKLNEARKKEIEYEKALNQSNSKLVQYKNELKGKVLGFKALENKVKKMQERVYELQFFKDNLDSIPSLVHKKWVKSALHKLLYIVEGQTPIPKSYLLNKWVFDSVYYGNIRKEGDKEKNIQHWLESGVYQGLASSKTFHVQYYLDQNPDLHKHFGKDYTGAIKHWLEHGIKEKRKSSPDINYRISLKDINYDTPVGLTVQNPTEKAIQEGLVAISNKDWNKALNKWEMVLKSSKDDSLTGRAKLNISILRRLISIDDYKSAIHSYRNHKVVSQPRIAVYTAIIDNYDTIKLPENLDDNITYILYTNNPCYQTGIWKIETVDYENADPTRVARYVKTHPHVLLKDFDIAIWIDSNIQLISSLKPFIDGFVESNKLIAAVPHPHRMNVYEEANKCIEFAKDEEQTMLKQMEAYRSESFEHKDLIESNFMIFDLRDTKVHDFLDTWWMEIQKFSKRDQLSLNYSLAKHNLEWYNIFDRPVSVRNHEAFAFGGHSRHDDGMSELLLKELNVSFIQNECLKDFKQNNKQAISAILSEFKFIQFTPPKASNAYYQEFPKALKAIGWDIYCLTDFEKIADLLKHNKAIISFHQLEPLYHQENIEKTWQSAKELLGRMKRISDNGGILINIWHNPLPHNRQYREVDLWLYNELNAIFDLAIVHLRSAMEYVEQYFDKNKIAYLPHPSFYGVYKGKISKSEARKRLGISPDAFVFLSLGEIKPYKGHDKLIQAWKIFSNHTDKKQAILYVAGRPHDTSIVKDLSHLTDCYVKLEYIPDDDIHIYFSAADVSVYSHRDIWTSGAAILSTTYGVPVIMPRSKYTSEYIVEGVNGFLYDPDDYKDLSLKMKLAMESPLLDHMRYVNQKQGSINSFKEVSWKLTDILTKI